VKHVTVNFEAREVTLAVDPTKHRPESVVEALAQAGFDDSRVKAQ
jgi:hypothetical protein